MPGPSTSTTTTAGVTTTSTTLPPACSRAPDFASLECRLIELAADIETAPDIQAERARLIVRLTAGRTAARTARTLCAASDTKRARKALLQSARKLQQYRQRLRTRAARRTLPPQLLTDLLESGDALRSDLKTLRATVRCPADAA